MAWLVNTLVALTGLLLGAVGLGWMIDPARTSSAWDIGALATFGSINLRAHLGGLHLGIAVFCGLYFVDGSKWLRAAAVLMTCVLVGRWAGIGLDGYLPQAMAAAMAEALVLLVLMAGMRFGGRP